MASVAYDLYARQPDCLIILHPHGRPVDETLGANVSESFNVDFKSFGDFVTNAHWPGALALASAIKERAEDHGFPLKFRHEPTVSYDVGVPLTLLAGHLPKVAVLPICPSTHDLQTHIHFGRLLAEVLHHSKQRVAVIASAELSQHVSAAAPSGIRPEGESFDKAITRGLGKKRWEHVLTGIDQTVVELAESCGYRALLILAGVLMKRNFHTHKLAYEHPFGIGFLTVIFNDA